MIAAAEFPPRSRPAHRKLTVKTRSYAYHESVLLAETLRALAPAPGKILVDGTLGGGGHAAALLAAGARVIGLDQDPAALDFAGKKIGAGNAAFTAVRRSFTQIPEVLRGLGIGAIDGALLDLGVSSHQIDTPERGFSFMHDGPLDMRMDPDGPITAADLVNTMSGDQLERIFRQFGEEPAGRRVAARLVRDRLVRPFTTTGQLAEAVESVIPRRGRTHPATRIFQALRLAVNRELEALAEGLQAFTACLAPGARFAVITFHSLEDRLVKTFFKARALEFLDRPEWPAPRPNPDHLFSLVTRKPIVASPAEQQANPRSRSARLRVVERLSHARQ